MKLTVFLNEGGMISTVFWNVYCADLYSIQTARDDHVFVVLKSLPDATGSLTRETILLFQFPNEIG